jgi:hypothetical protein
MVLMIEFKKIKVGHGLIKVIKAFHIPVGKPYNSPIKKKIWSYRSPRYCHTALTPPRWLIPHSTAPRRDGRRAAVSGSN